MTAAFSSGEFHSEAEFHLGRLKALERFARSRRPGLAAWALTLLEETREQYERSRQVEEAWRAGALEVPIHEDASIPARLYEIALAQQGLFTKKQAERAGCSGQLLNKYLHSNKVERVMRGVYRWVAFPRGEHENLVAIWLRFEGLGVFSHTTALALHELSGVLPEKAHLTLPEAWRKRRLNVPGGVVLHYSRLVEAETAWIGPLRVTSVVRTLADCEAAHLSPDLLEEARTQAIERGLLTREPDSMKDAEIS